MEDGTDTLIEHFNQKLRERDARISWHHIPNDWSSVYYGIKKDVSDGIFELDFRLSPNLELKEVERNPWLSQMPTNLKKFESVFKNALYIQTVNVDAEINLESMPNDRGVSTPEARVLFLEFSDHWLKKASYGERNPTAKKYREAISSLRSPEDAREAIDLVFKIYDEANSVGEIRRD
jgi:hypothetical protein